MENLLTWLVREHILLAAVTVAYFWGGFSLLRRWIEAEQGGGISIMQDRIVRAMLLAGFLTTIAMHGDMGRFIYWLILMTLLFYGGFGAGQIFNSVMRMTKGRLFEKQRLVIQIMIIASEMVFLLISLGLVALILLSLATYY